MAKLNLAAKNRRRTHEGGMAAPAGKPEQELLRAVSNCMLWENTFYERGAGIADRIAVLCERVSAEDLSAVAHEARHEIHLRHVPLFLARQMARLHTGPIVGNTIADVIRRPDECSEFLALYWQDGRSPLSSQVKRGLRLAFESFSQYQLAKYASRSSAIKLRDVMFLVHPQPPEGMADVYRKIAEGGLEPADTWEVALSGGADKGATWTRLLEEKSLGFMALLMNLRNMAEAGVDRSLVEDALRSHRGAAMAFPYRYLAAARQAPQFAEALSDAMVASLQDRNKLSGSTAVLLDVSGSMGCPMSSRSQMTRMDAAGCLGAMLRELCESARIFTFSNRVVEVQNYRGLPLADSIPRSQHNASTYLAEALRVVEREVCGLDRVIVLTDEQSHDGQHRAWVPRSYLINVAPYSPSLDISQGWTRINGWSDRVVDWILVEEGKLAEAA